MDYYSILFQISLVVLVAGLVLWDLRRVRRNNKRKTVFARAKHDEVSAPTEDNEVEELRKKGIL